MRVDLSREDAQRIVQALSGLTLNQARQVIASAVVDDGSLSVADLQTIIKRKGQLIEHGGFERLKAWLESARIGFTPAARELNLEAPEGHPYRRRADS